MATDTTQPPAEERPARSDRSAKATSKLLDEVRDILSTGGIQMTDISAIEEGGAVAVSTPVPQRSLKGTLPRRFTVEPGGDQRWIVRLAPEVKEQRS